MSNDGGCDPFKLHQSLEHRVQLEAETVWNDPCVTNNPYHGSGWHFAPNSCHAIAAKVEQGHVLWGQQGHVLWGQQGHALWGQKGHVL